MKIVIKRVMMNEILTTYLPTTLLMIIVYTTPFFKAKNFEASLSVNLSVMFVMTTLFVSVMEKLPQTSYVRMVDIWLIFGQLLPFLQVVITTFKESCRDINNASDNGKGGWLDNFQVIYSQSVKILISIILECERLSRLEN